MVRQGSSFDEAASAGNGRRQRHGSARRRLNPSRPAGLDRLSITGQLVLRPGWFTGAPLLGVWWLSLSVHAG